MLSIVSGIATLPNEMALQKAAEVLQNTVMHSRYTLLSLVLCARRTYSHCNNEKESDRQSRVPTLLRHGRHGLRTSCDEYFVGPSPTNTLLCRDTERSTLRNRISDID